ncbi:bifunctional adenosylcobinamide kinase/adenosylcobinamide-phosphate guanylyltransferase [Sulfitobacter pseudonitzschiae]|uniref:Bifunctional adenosylcobalamin biosynthesis protein n=2 Tax=Pseudosulfitobacter pseudonitzschiae TaxID=1402135 RepID=A0A9Q2NK77_9RHOB|nr:bifunctional adenosylcobinamide kinase/adenosylcobinamide-phosphate guanylyltransferase [Pseudosulfitobacter pseudonitzschiae]MBM2293669.1 bifunctional adenosylcobinamide kinase/adenosylcobinamide-phosphate guanylyltransferase [Pseudosulfitobacter pseudonitzschiae]MBM2298483.1 bifunctional adenosylcobinamide kinase/adenosylcobinamide-phosphate guanylyltransferase [Pseudosulfitobacter pseudonitzschiae]MBM2303397.1 bifunctional adenosylcobinamide kinase/adenosylcobinamide-phosphate guanylyltran
MLPSMTFVLGGAASGKSAFAENVIINSGLIPVYLATARIWDAEIKDRVKVHRDRRDAAWINFEATHDLAHVLCERDASEAVLIDCATMWLTNHVMDGNNLAQAQAALMQALDDCAAPVVIVSNELGQGIVPADADTRAFREAQGRLNIALAARADTAIQVVAGLPNVLKGSL